MPAYLLQRAMPQEDTEEKRKQLRLEIEGYTGAGAVYRYKVRNFMEEHGIWSLEELDYTWRLAFAKAIQDSIVSKYHPYYLKCFDHLKQYDMRKRVQLRISRKGPRYPYEDILLFLPYHPVQELVERLDACPEKPEWVWDFSVKAPRKMKRQVFDVLNHFLKEDEDGRLLRNHLKKLRIFYQFCVEAQVEDIEQIQPGQIADYKRLVKERGDSGGRGVLDICRRILFLQAEEINWEADVWYLERLFLQPERTDPSNPVVSLSFTEVLHDGNRKLLKQYMKYGIGLTDLTIRSLQGEMIEIRNFLEEMGMDLCTATGQELARYFKKLQEQHIKAETFNRKVMAVQHFYNFLLARGYVEKIPFHAEYYLKKTLPQHHDRCVEEEAAEEIMQKLHQFPENLRLMYLHLWGIGLRVSEVCTLKGDAYYIQGRDAWIQVYQTKMKNYKRIPIPDAVYRLMQVYIRRHHIAADSYVFQNKKGGPYRSATFRKQMIKCCEEFQIQDGEYLFQSHDYRHGVATYFYNNGVSLQGVRDYLGHTYEEMTQQYVDYMPGRIDRTNKEFFAKPGNSLMARLKGGEA